MSWCVMIMHNDDMITFLIIFLTSGMLHKIGARFASNVLLDQKSFWTDPMELLGDVVM